MNRKKVFYSLCYITQANGIACKPMLPWHRSNTRRLHLENNTIASLHTTYVPYLIFRVICIENKQNLGHFHKHVINITPY